MWLVAIAVSGLSKSMLLKAGTSREKYGHRSRWPRALSGTFEFKHIDTDEIKATSGNVKFIRNKH